MIAKMQYILKLVKKINAKCLRIAKFYVNKNQSQIFFEVSDKVFFKVKPLRNGLRVGKCPKLCFQYCGPFG